MRKGFLDRAWRLPGSMKFAIYLFIITALLSLFSLLIAEFIPAESIGSPFVEFFKLSDPFRAWWFRLLLTILSASLTFCIIRRGPALIRQAFSRTFVHDPEALKTFKSYRRFETSAGDAWISGHLRRRGLSVRRDERGDTVAISGCSGSLSRLGPLLNHLGMLLLIIGGLAVSITGYRVQVSGEAGDTVTRPEWDFDLFIDNFKIIYHPLSINQWVETTDSRRCKVIELRDDSAMVMLSVHHDASQHRWFHVDSLRNDFLIREGDRSTPYQGNVKSYVTSAVLITDKARLPARRIEVNHPLRFRGYRFYQSSFEAGGVVTEVDIAGITITPTGYRTILDVRHERGRWIIWAGLLICTLGLMLLYSMNHRRAWAVVIRRTGGCDTVHLAVRCSRSDYRFYQYFDDLTVDQ